MITATKIMCFLGFCSVFSPGMYGQKRGLQVVKQWKQLDWAYNSERERQNDMASGEFVPGNGVPIDMDVIYNNNNNNMPKIFVSVPRFIDGIPSTLNTISETTNNGEPLLAPYPSWEWNRNSAECRPNRIVSVFRTQIDECGRLWVLDTGKIGSNQLCQPQVIAFDPISDKVLHRYEVPTEQINQNSLLITPVVDVRDPKAGCRDTFVYAADVTGFGIIVVDIKNNKSWRTQNKLFFPIPEFGTFTIAGESFDLMDGVLGMALSPFQPGQDRVLFFHALASNTENYVYTSVLRNQSIFYENADAQPRQFQVFKKKRPSQAPAEAIDRNGVMYFGLTREITMNCWNTHTEYEERNFDVIDNNPVTLQFASGVKVINNRENMQELWVMTCRFQKVMTGTINPAEINFRIQAAKTDDLLRGSKCKKSRGGQTNAPGGGYGLVPRPQQAWGGIFSDIVNKVTPSPNPKRDTEMGGDKIIFQN